MPDKAKITLHDMYHSKTLGRIQKRNKPGGGGEIRKLRARKFLRYHEKINSGNILLHHNCKQNFHARRKFLTLRFFNAVVSGSTSSSMNSANASWQKCGEL